jgi:hypothetical protein
LVEVDVVPVEDIHTEPVRINELDNETKLELLGFDKEADSDIADMTVGEIMRAHGVDTRCLYTNNRSFFCIGQKDFLVKHLPEAIDIICGSADWISICEVSVIAALVYDFNGLNTAWSCVSFQTVQGYIRRLIEYPDVSYRRSKQWNRETDACSLRMAGVDSPYIPSAEIGVNTQESVNVFVNMLSLEKLYVGINKDRRVVELFKPHESHKELPVAASCDDWTIDEDVQEQEYQKQSMYVIRVRDNNDNASICVCDTEMQAARYADVVRFAYLKASVDREVYYEELCVC